MKKIFILIGLCLAFGVDAKQATSTDAIKQKIIQQSIDRYPGNCPCPYNTASNGSRCGKRSAYNRAGGHHLCVIRKMSVIGWSKSIKAVVNYQVRILSMGKNEIFSTVYLQICMLQLFRKIS